MIIMRIGRLVNKILSKWGYRVTGSNFLSAAEICRQAKQKGMSVADYIENEDAKRDVKHVGRRDRIVDRILRSCSFQCDIRCLEIGPGTGRYMDKILQSYPDASYEIYEVASDWVSYLERTYSKRYKVDIKHADGHTLSETEISSCDLVHAHAVFVYLPNCVTLSYMDEMARVVKQGGIIAFDALAEPSFDMNVLRRYIQSDMWFPIIFPEAVIMQWAQLHNLALLDKFDEIYGAHRSNYYVFKKGEW
jgi:phospholipid N-methyltransferase